MPCPHNEITIVQRSQRQSAVAAAAYQSGEKLFCEYDQQVKHYPEKRGIVHNEILLPANAPQKYMTRVNAKGYFDAEDSEYARYEKKTALNAQRIVDYKNGNYAPGGGVVDPLPDNAPFYVKDYHDYYKTERGYHPRSLNSNGGWNVTGCMSFMNQPILKYTNEIRSAVLMIHGEKAHSCYFSRDAYADMVKDNPYADNKELMIIPDAVHTDLYDRTDIIPFDKIEKFMQDNMK